ncbi:hypothetical protein [Buttiauxella ferragutiae]|uniref:hypothetical protein n=1 Tax=Buttiauxella ferragutiae TaxID=82989 RepID=UPI001F530544|nr:hypothetical protein [Buttiauxella ferragutiae]UNK62569.1 hypothetical protein MNO13_06440 [Buttiauxella ferragutiae]
MKTTPAKQSSPVAEKPFWLNFEFQLRRVGFVLLLLIVAAALAGLFSRGYLSEATRSNDDHSLTLDYEKFNRLMSDMDMKITSVTPPGKRNRIVLGGDFMEGFRIDTLQPQPDKMYSLNGEMILEYQPIAPGVKQTLWLSLTPMKFGAMKSTVAIDNGAEIPFQQFIYP